MREAYLDGAGAAFLGDFCSSASGLGAFRAANRDGAPSGGVPVPEEAALGILFAARAYLAERAAMCYLARAEYCRRQLAERLARKGFAHEESDAALSFLEGERKLDDGRYAAAWLRSRMIRQSEGKMKLLANLLSRGISSRVAEAALTEFFGDIDERELCVKAAEKLIRLGKTGDKLRGALIRKGFSGKLVAEVAKKAAER